MKAKRKKPQVILKNGKPNAVILDIKDYQEMLERLEDAHDLKQLRRMRSRPMKFRLLEEVLKDLGSV
jgi:prevent-host-death family protein